MTTHNIRNFTITNIVTYEYINADIKINKYIYIYACFSELGYGM